MPTQPKTREEDLSDRRSQRAFYYVSGGALAGVCVAAIVWLGIMQETLLHPAVIAVSAGGVVMGLAMVFMATRIDTEPDSRLPAFEALPEDDPRKARPLAARRRDWLLGVGIWAAGWVLLGLGMMGPFDALPGLVRVVAFLALPWGSVALGARFMRTRTGSTSWPAR